MDTLKKIILKYNFLFLNVNTINFSIIIILFLVHLLIFFFLKKKKNNIIISYFNNFIKQTINKNSRNIILFYSLIIFYNIFFSNLIDLFPNNLIKNFFQLKIFEFVPTSNISITFCFAILSFITIITITKKKIGFKNFFFNFFIYPINNKYLYIFNFLIESVSYLMKPISLSLRLFGNIFSSEIIFHIISSMNLFCNILLNLVWSVFHYLILPLQSFIFITLVIIYISQNLNH